MTEDVGNTLSIPNSQAALDEFRVFLNKNNVKYSVDSDTAANLDYQPSSYNL